MKALLTKSTVKSPATQAAAQRDGRLRVLHLLTSFELGGTERQAVELLKRLDQTRYDVRLAAIHRRGPLYAELAAQYPKLHEFPLDRLYNPHALRQVWRLRAVLRTEAIDLLHAHDFYAGWLGTFAAQFTPVRVIACQRHVRLSDRRIHAVGRRLINRLAQRVLVNAELIRQRVLETGTAAEKVVVIHNGLPFPTEPATRHQVRGDLCRELQLPDHVQLIGTVANLRPVKGHRYLLQAAARVIRQFPQAHFVLVGEGELRDALQAQVTDLAIQANVHLLGHRHDAARLAQAFDLSVLASLHEGLPNTVMEAMAAGVPVICTAVGGAPELITDGETGYLVPAADSASLAERIVAALTNAAECAQVAERGRTFVLDQFSMQRMVAATERLYDELAAVPQTISPLGSPRLPATS